MAVNSTVPHILELASYELLKLVSENIEDVIDQIDAEMYETDEEAAKIMGPYYGPQPTPKPSKYRQGHLPTVETLTVADYPYISCWGQDMGVYMDQGGFTETRARMVMQAFLIAKDATWLARNAYRYIGAFQNITANTTLNGLCDPVVTSGRVDITPTIKREFDDMGGIWFVQAVVYQFQAHFVETDLAFDY